MTNVLADVMLGVGVDMLFDMENAVMNTSDINLEFLVRASYTVDVLAVVMTDVVTVIDVDMLADENENGLVAVPTPLEFTLPAP